MMKRIPLILLTAASFASSDIPYSVIIVVDNNTDYKLTSDITSTEPTALAYHGSNTLEADSNDATPFLFDHDDKFSVTLSNLALESDDLETAIPCNPNTLSFGAKMPTKITNLYVTGDEESGCKIEIIN